MWFSSGQEVFLKGDAGNELSHKLFLNASCLTVTAIYPLCFQWMRCGVAVQKSADLHDSSNGIVTSFFCLFVFIYERLKISKQLAIMLPKDKLHDSSKLQ